MRPFPASLLLLGLAVTPAAAFDITTCGQIVPAGETGVLLNDLDCSGTSLGSNGIVLLRKSSVDLQGHTIIGSHFGPGPNEAGGNVRCSFGSYKCHETSSGTFCKAPNGTCRVFSTGGTAQLTGDGTFGIISQRSVVVENIAVTAVLGISADLSGRIDATDVSVTGGNGGIYGGKMRFTNVTSSGTTQFGVFAPFGEVRGTNVTVTDNARGGILAGKVKITGLTATGNGSGPTFALGGGVSAGSMTLVDSTVTGNTFDGRPLDLSSARQPKLVNTTCGYSEQRNETGNPPWGVCTND
jgi:hypothetical protein